MRQRLETCHREALLDILCVVNELAVDLSRRTGRRVPLLVKLPLSTVHDPMFEIACAAVQAGFAGIVADQSGPGNPEATLIRLAGALPAHAAIVSVGGIDSGRTALERLSVGAQLIQIHRAFAERGPELIDEIRRTLRCTKAAAA
jgi:dihydroorotate dehydrogenase